MGLTVSLILPLRSCLVLAAALVWFVWPGVLFVLRQHGHDQSGRLVAVLLGGPIGYALSSLALLLLWSLGVRSTMWLASAPCLAAPAAWLLGGIGGRLTGPRFSMRDVPAVCALLLIVPLVVARPYARVGETVPDGRAYRAYFTADFVWAVAVVAEVAKGDVPPQNPYRTGDALHYYWLAHLLPAVEARATKWPIEKLLLTNAVFSGLAFLAFLYVLARHAVNSPIAASLGCAGAVLVSSFEGLEELVSLWRMHAPIDLVRYMNIDGVTRWVYGSLLVDGLHRLLLYQPQHQFGYAVALSGLLALLDADDRLDPANLARVALLVALGLLLSTFSALMILIIIVTIAALDLLRTQCMHRLVPCAIAGAVPITAAVLLGGAMRYVEAGGSLVSLEVNALAVHRAPVAIALSFGPVLIAWIIGGVLAWRRRRAIHLAWLWVVMAVCFFFYFFVDIRDHQDVYVGWRAAHLLFISAAAWYAFVLEQLWRGRRRTRTALLVASSILVAAGVPTTAIGVYNAQDTSNRERTSEFAWTLVLSHDEVEALEWIKQSTPATSIVQVEPVVRGRETWAYIPAFAERRMAAGLPISMVPLEKYARLSQRVREVYESTSADELQNRATHMRIEYLVLGPPEQEKYPHLAPMLDARPDLFTPAFRNRSVRIYLVSQRT